MFAQWVIVDTNTQLLVAKVSNHSQRKTQPAQFNIPIRYLLASGYALVAQVLAVLIIMLHKGGAVGLWGNNGWSMVENGNVLVETLDFLA